MDTDDKMKIATAYYAAEKRRPYAVDKDVIAAVTPGGGDWTCEAKAGAITRSVMWGGTEVALVNPRGQLSDATEGDIAMGLRAMPVCDKALRVIMALAQDPENAPLIAQIANSVIAYIELPAPKITRPADEEDDEGDEEDRG